MYSLAVMEVYDSQSGNFALAPRAYRESFLALGDILCLMAASLPMVAWSPFLLSLSYWWLMRTLVTGFRPTWIIQDDLSSQYP